MSQKINSLGFKLGILQLWNFNIPVYNSSFKFYKKYIYISKYTFIYFRQIFKKHNILLNKITISYINQQFFLTISFYNFDNYITFLKKAVFNNFLYFWWGNLINLTLYKNQKLTISSFLITNYIIYVIESKNYSFKKSLHDLFKILKDISKDKKIIYTTSGLKVIELKGFKMQLSGCFENSRSQMSKILKYNYGLIPLTKLNGCIEYSTSCLFTKLGICNLKIWLFYEFKSI